VFAHRQYQLVLPEYARVLGVRVPEKLDVALTNLYPVKLNGSRRWKRYCCDTLFTVTPGELRIAPHDFLEDELHPLPPLLCTRPPASARWWRPGLSRF
jgi:hypothetical protein